MTIAEKHFGPIWFIPGDNEGKYPFCHSIYIEGPGILITTFCSWEIMT